MPTSKPNISPNQFPGSLQVDPSPSRTRVISNRPDTLVQLINANGGLPLVVGTLDPSMSSQPRGGDGGSGLNDVPANQKPPR